MLTLFCADVSNSPAELLISEQLILFHSCLIESGGKKIAILQVHWTIQQPFVENIKIYVAEGKLGVQPN